MSLKFGKIYDNEYGQTSFSESVLLEAICAFDCNMKYNKKTVLVNFSNDRLGELLEKNNIRVKRNDKWGYSVFITIPNNKQLKKDDTIYSYVYIKKFINKRGEEFNSLILSEA